MPRAIIYRRCSRFAADAKTRREEEGEEDEGRTNGNATSTPMCSGGRGLRRDTNDRRPMLRTQSVVDISPIRLRNARPPSMRSS